MQKGFRYRDGGSIFVHQNNNNKFYIKKKNYKLFYKIISY